MNKDIIIKELIETDKIFCEECKLDGADAWIKYLTQDSIMVTSSTNSNIKGKNNIGPIMKNLFNQKNISFIWKPTFADVSDDYTLGFTSGVYIRKYNKDNVKIIEEGKYLTIWKKESNTWKISLDIGN